MKLKRRHYDPYSPAVWAASVKGSVQPTFGGSETKTHHPVSAYWPPCDDRLIKRSESKVKTRRTEAPAKVWHFQHVFGVFCEDGEEEEERREALPKERRKLFSPMRSSVYPNRL